MSASERARIEALYAEHHEALSRYLVRYTGDADAAADLAQETFVRLLERTPSWEAPVAWLFRVATNLAHDASRRRTRRRVLLLQGAGRTPHADAPPGPEEAAQSGERRDAVRAALATLSEKERSALLMREEGYSHKEIAVAVGTTTKSVGTLIARSARKLADRLGLDAEEI